MAAAGEVFATLLEEATLELLRGYGVEATLLDHERSELMEVDQSSLVGIIGFSGEDMCGSVRLRIPMLVAVQTHPQKDPAPTPTEVHDWVGELCNQLLGRAKNQLLRFGQRVGLGTPVVASSASGLSLVSADAGRAAVFSCGESTCTMSCDVRTGAALELVELPPDFDDEAGQEGDCFLF